jgi:hypothetical protein
LGGRRSATLMGTRTKPAKMEKGKYKISNPAKRTRRMANEIHRAVLGLDCPS